MSIEILPREEWDVLSDIFREQFDSYLPQGNSIILVDRDHDGKVTGFVVLETLFRIGQIWNTGTQSRAMLDFFDERITGGSSVIAISSDSRFDGLCEKYEMYPVEGKVYRKDF